MGRLTRVGGLALAAFIAAGCTPVATIYGDDVTNAPTHSLRRVEGALVRHTIPAEGITITATLWDAALVAAAADTSSPSGHPVDSDRWAHTYLRQTSFTVVVEVADRRPAIDPASILEAEAWRFALAGVGAQKLRPATVDLLLVDRFPTRGGGHHHRLAFSVHFDASLYELAASADEPLEIRLFVATGPTDKGKRRPLGRAMATRGASLGWRLTAARQLGTPTHS